jgi:paired amphipathic helix protein Sin3a
VEDAMSFVQMVKAAFKERHPDKYHLFLRVMDDFRNQRIGIAEVASTAKALFQDTPDLALGFNVFLPKGHRIQVGLDELAACFIRDMNLDDDDDDGDDGH